MPKPLDEFMESTAEQSDGAEPYTTGEALTAEEALDVTLAAPTRVVVIAGPAQSGKTTLVASVYEQFHLAPLADYLFAGSRTLVGFERRCHLSRRASGRETPDTERTSRAASDLLLHLSVRGVGGGPRQDLLFTDIYGEAFRQAADSTDEAELLTVLKRADHVAILADGEKLASPRHRQEPFSQADALLASCLQVGILGPLSQIQLVVTKADKLHQVLRLDANLKFVEDRWATLKDKYWHRFASFEKFEVAARPEAGSKFVASHGLGTLFSLWVTRSRPQTLNADDLHQKTLSPFDGFARVWPAK